MIPQEGRYGGECETHRTTNTLYNILYSLVKLVKNVMEELKKRNNGDEEESLDFGTAGGKDLRVLGGSG